MTETSKNVLQHALPGGTLGTLIVVGLLSRNAFETQLEATDRAIESIAEVRNDLRGLREDVTDLRTTTEVVATALDRAEEAVARNSVRLDALEQEVARLKVCIRNRRRCAEEEG